MPSSLAVAVRVKPVSLFVTVTDALATAAPFGSVTVPVICPVLACDCAEAVPTPRARQRSTNISALADRRRKDVDIRSSFSNFCRWADSDTVETFGGCHRVRRCLRLSAAIQVLDITEG